MHENVHVLREHTVMPCRFNVSAQPVVGKAMSTTRSAEAVRAHEMTDEIDDTRH